MTDSVARQPTADELLTAIRAALAARDMPAVAGLMRRLAVVDPHAADAIMTVLEAGRRPAVHFPTR